jgi:hypothetical protein
MKRESMLHGISSQQTFEVLPLKPNGHIKTWVRTTENHPIHQSPGMGHLVADGVFCDHPARSMGTTSD